MERSVRDPGAVRLNVWCNLKPVKIRNFHSCLLAKKKTKNKPQTSYFMITAQTMALWMVSQSHGLYKDYRDSN